MSTTAKTVICDNLSVSDTAVINSLHADNLNGYSFPGRIQDATDVQINAPGLQANETLVYQTISGKFENKAVGLANVVLTNVQANQYLRTDISNNWVNATIAISVNTLTDVDIAGVSAGQVLKYNAGTAKWENMSLAIGDLADVDATGSVAGDLLKFDDSDSTWKAGQLTLAELTDVNVAGAADTLILAWNSGTSKFAFVAASAGNLAALDDVTLIGTPAVGEVLMYGAGGAWENKALSNLNLSIPLYVDTPAAQAALPVGALYCRTAEDFVRVVTAPPP